MKKVLTGALAASMLSFSVTALADLSDVPSGKYTLDKTHGYITFSYSHLGFSNPHVGFNSFDVNVDLDSKNPEKSKVNVTIDASSIDSRVEVFNGHLNGENFFDTANYDTITFNSTKITAQDADTFTVNGDLTIKGITKPVTLVAELNKAANHPMRKVPTIGFSGEAKVKRSEWGLDRAVPAVGDEVTIYIEVELPQAKD
tara:strand:+ start:2738 stop:3337 length:600 start_codon:yes stop_codon:yes gene_type:complete